MDRILELFKNYFGIAFLLLIISYLSPKECYRRYFQFLISILIAVILFQPLAEEFLLKKSGETHADWEEMEEKLSAIQYDKMMEADIFECFGMEEVTEQMEKSQAQ